MDELSVFIWFVVVPIGFFALAVMVVNFVMAPMRLNRDQKKELARLKETAAGPQRGSIRFDDLKLSRTVHVSNIIGADGYSSLRGTVTISNISSFFLAYKVRLVLALPGVQQDIAPLHVPGKFIHPNSTENFWFECSNLPLGKSPGLLHVGYVIDYDTDPATKHRISRMQFEVNYPPATEGSYPLNLKTVEHVEE